MIDTSKTNTVEMSESSSVTPLPSAQSLAHADQSSPGLVSQLLRFGLVGGLNTLVDLLTLNVLLWTFPTTQPLMLLTFNALAYSLGALNSFLLNKYWTFRHRHKTTWGEIVRFLLTTLCGLVWSSGILWLASSLLASWLSNPTLWANVSKVLAILGTALISYLGMRLWVFVKTQSSEPESVARPADEEQVSGGPNIPA